MCLFNFKKLFSALLFLDIKLDQWPALGLADEPPDHPARSLVTFKVSDSVVYFVQLLALAAEY